MLFGQIALALRGLLDARVPVEFDLFDTPDQRGESLGIEPVEQGNAVFQYGHPHAKGGGVFRAVEVRALHGGLFAQSHKLERGFEESGILEGVEEGDHIGNEAADFVLRELCEQGVHGGGILGVAGLQSALACLAQEVVFEAACLPVGVEAGPSRGNGLGQPGSEPPGGCKSPTHQRLELSGRVEDGGEPLEGRVNLAALCDGGIDAAEKELAEAVDLLGRNGFEARKSCEVLDLVAFT